MRLHVQLQREAALIMQCRTAAGEHVPSSVSILRGITVGKVCERYVYLPIHAITKQKGNRVDIKGAAFIETS